MKALTKEEATAVFSELDTFKKKFTPTFQKKLVAKADGGVICCESVDSGVPDVVYMTQDDASYLYSRLDSIRQDYWNLWEKLYDHMNNGHIPQIIGAEKMQTALNALGLGKDYKVEPKTIYASNGQPESVTLTFKANNG